VTKKAHADVYVQAVGGEGFISAQIIANIPLLYPCLRYLCSTPHSANKSVDTPSLDTYIHIYMYVFFAKGVRKPALHYGGVDLR
jgi:hypothetical protein